MANNFLALLKLSELVVAREVYRFKNKFLTLDNDEYIYTQFHSQFGEDRFIFRQFRNEVHHLGGLAQGGSPG